MLFRKPARSLLTGVLVLCLASIGVLAMRLLPQQPSPQRGGPLTPPPKISTEKSGPLGSAPAPDGGLTVGERLTFNISWSNFVTAARMELEVAGRGAFFGQEGYQLRTRVETVGYARSLLADVDNQYNSYVDATTMLPYRLENSTRQGRARSDELVTLDQAKNAARYGDGSETRIPPGTRDLPAMLYALRYRDLKPGTSHKFTVLFGKTVTEVEATAKPSERVITQAGAFDAIRVDFNSKGSSFDAGKYRVRAWFSNDAQRLPVLVTARPPFGELRAELSSSTISNKPKTDISRNQGATPLLATTGNPPPGAVFEAISLGEVPPDNLPFLVGERLNYDISWGNFASVGKANFSVRRQGKFGDHRVFEFVTETASTGAARAVMSINDIFTSYADAEKLMPVRTELRLREGSRDKEITADYDWAGNAVKLSNGTGVAVKPKTFDLVSLFYAVRAADLKVGSTYTFDFLDSNHRLKSMTFKVMKQETIGSPLGAQEALQLDILRTENQQLISQAWVTNDARRLPIYIAVRLRIGELRFQLTSLSGAR
ncbi:MAG TPA: DUF3108 domain-containing protein [Blastocatellia bacterium]|nr:DUF3108 domain-containing protein [Blastocatellia bacterium]